MPTESELFLAVKQLFEEKWKERAHALEKDFKKKKLTKEYRVEIDAWLGWLAKARATYTASSPPKTLDVDVEAAQAALHWGLRPIPTWWITKMGGAFAMRAYGRTWAIDWYGIERGNYINDNDRHPEFPVAHNMISPMFDMRDALAESSDAVRKDARAEADAIRKRAPLALRCVLDFIFPDETAWVDEDAVSLAAESEPHFGYLFHASPELAACLLATRGTKAARYRIATLLAKWGESAVNHGTPAFVEQMLAMHGADAIEELVVIMAKATGKHRTEYAEQLATMAGSIDVARVFAQSLEDKLVRAAAQKYLEANPAVAKTALEEVVAKHGKVAEAAARLLSRSSVATSAVAPAKASDLPSVLREPPWEKKKAKPKLQTVAITKALAYREAIVWKAGERDKALDPGIGLDLLRNWNEIPKNAKTRTSAMDEHIEKKLQRAGDGSDFFKRLHYASSFLHAMSDKGALAAWNKYPPNAWGLYADDLVYALARFDLAGIDGWLRVAAALPQKAIEGVAHVDSHRVAPFVADTFKYTKRAAVTARKWLLAHAEASAIALVPLALSPNPKDAKRRVAPCAALRAIDSGGAGDAVRAVAKKYGEDALVAIGAVLAFDPLDDYPDKLPKLPDFFEAKALPAPELAKGGALPPEAITHIATMLAFSHPLDPYPGLELVKAACEPRSLAAFAWALFQEWMLAGADSKHDWALVALAHFGDDEVARNLAPKIREWPGDGGHARAVKGLDVLAAIGSDVAIMHLDRIAQKLKFKGLQEKARVKMQEVAESRGLTADELGDRIAPTLDLDDTGSRTLSLGARSFRVGFDADLKPFVQDTGGKRIGDLPKAGKTDDSAIAKASHEIWKALKKDARTVATTQIFRLERAMCTERKWDAALFRTFFVEHPLVSHLVTRLVWRAGEKTFRVAEDRTFTDDQDRSISLASDAVVALPHALSMDANVVQAWSKIFGDYEILQPFNQLARDTYAITAEEKRDTKIKRFVKKKVPTGKVLRLEDRGWRKGFAQDAGWIWDMKKDLGDGVTAELAIGGGILAGDLRESPEEQELGAITLSAKLDTLSVIAFSELVRDVAQMLDAV